MTVEERVAAMDAWIGTRPMDIQRLAREFPAGMIIDLDDERLYVVGYSEVEGNVEPLLMISRIDPVTDYEGSLAAAERICADHLRGPHCVRLADEDRDAASQADLLAKWAEKTQVVNCLTCGTGSSWRSEADGRCLMCGGDPLVAGSGRSDWEEFSRAKTVARFGPRMPGDAELLEKYRGEVQ